MTQITNTKKIVAGLMSLAMVFGAVVVPATYAKAQTTTASVYTRDLTVGSRGADVTSLQAMLQAGGFLSVAPTGYFGPLTKAALGAWQASVGISPAAGYFGPITRAYIATHGTTGGTTSNVPGCMPGAKFSSTTGQPCTGGTGNNNDGTLSGGAGSVDQYSLVSGLSNEQVGEGEENVEVAGLKIEADEGSDLRLTAVRLVFDEGTAGSDFEDYADKVTLMLDGKKIASVDADEFNDDNNWTKNLSVSSSAIIGAGDTAELTVAITGAGNLDTNDIGDTWTVDFRTIRFVDAQGASTSEDPNTGTRTFSFASFASANDVELKIAEDDASINDAHTISVDATDDTEGVELLSFTLQAKGDSDLKFNSITASTTVTGASHVDDMVKNIYLVIDGEEYEGEAFHDPDGVDVGSDEAYIFDDLDFTVDAGDKVKAVIKADLFSVADDLDEGDTIKVEITENETDVTTGWDVEDESGEQLADADITGSATGEADAVYSTGIKVTLVESSSSPRSYLSSESTGADNDAGTFVIKYRVEALGDTVYVSDSGAATTDQGEVGLDESTIPFASGVVFVVDEAGTATVADLSPAGGTITWTRISGNVTDTGITNGVRLDEGAVAEFTLTVTRANSGDADDDGTYRMYLDGIGWATSDTSTMNVYDFDLEDFNTDPLFIN